MTIKRQEILILIWISFRPVYDDIVLLWKLNLEKSKFRLGSSSSAKIWILLPKLLHQPKLDRFQFQLKSLPPVVKFCPGLLLVTWAVLPFCFPNDKFLWTMTWPLAIIYIPYHYWPTMQVIYYSWIRQKEILFYCVSVGWQKGVNPWQKWDLHPLSFKAGKSLRSADGNLASFPHCLLPLLQDKCHPCSCQACLRWLEVHNSFEVFQC